MFIKCSLRYWLQHRWQVLLMLLGMALGVAVVFAVEIANSSAKRGFSLSLDAVTGRTTHQIIGGVNGLDETLYTRLRTQAGFRRSAPVVTGEVVLAGEAFQLLGVDLFAEPMFRDDTSSSGVIAGRGRDSLDLLKAGSALLAARTAKRLSLLSGDNFSIRVNGNHHHQLRLIDVLDTDRQAAFESMIMVDIATAQRVLGMSGKLSRIDLVVSTADGLAMLKQYSRPYNIVESESRNESLRQMTSAFHTNLLAMSLLALLVGAFLIYNTVTLSVLQRRQLFGTLRVAGVTRNELFTAILVEATLLAIAGTLLGLLLGWLLGSSLLTLVTRTINDLYFAVDVRRPDVSLSSIAMAFGLGVAAAVIAAIAPAAEAAGSPPATVLRRSSIEKQTGKAVPVLFIAGVGLILFAAIILWLSRSSLWAGFAALFLIVVGYSLLIPEIVLKVASAVTTSNGRLSHALGPMGHYPVRSLTANLSRTSVAIAALVVAVSSTAGVGIMINSFRYSVIDWLGQTLTSDVYVRVAESQHAVMPAALKKELSALEGITGLRLARNRELDLNGVPVRLLSLEYSEGSSPGFNFKSVANDQYLQRFQTTDAVFISEPFSWRSGLSSGDDITLYTEKGSSRFSIEGVVTDYSAGKGLIVMNYRTYQRHWNDSSFSSIGIQLEEDIEIDQFKQSLRSTLSRYPMEFSLRSNREIREVSLTIFDRTFAITHVLRLLTVGVAFVGILSALLALALERRREFAVLRALGLTPAELSKLLFVQSGLMGLVAGVLALPLGYLMSRILVDIINVRSFGWSMDFHVPAIVLLQTVALAVVAALIAGIYPSIMLSRLSAAGTLRNL
ncbi:hypothetical protein AB833_14755 [Chromatiales bacterium (ex Bugula neritina AB1)]|nr:hypothetical protein AB833_14755 [Chromatiales bacterium (ex Bugula neritina AB1)]